MDVLEGYGFKLLFFFRKWGVLVNRMVFVILLEKKLIFSKFKWFFWLFFVCIDLIYFI